MDKTFLSGLADILTGKESVKTEIQTDSSVNKSILLFIGGLVIGGLILIAAMRWAIKK